MIAGILFDLWRFQIFRLYPRIKPSLFLIYFIQLGTKFIRYSGWQISQFGIPIQIFGGYYLIRLGLYIHVVIYIISKQFNFSHWILRTKNILFSSLSFGKKMYMLPVYVFCLFLASSRYCEKAGYKAQTNFMQLFEFRVA